MLPLKTRRRAPRDLIPAPPRGGRFRVGSYAGVTGARPSLVTCGQNGFLRRVQRKSFRFPQKCCALAGVKNGFRPFTLFAHTKTRFFDDTSPRPDFPGCREQK